MPLKILVTQPSLPPLEEFVDSLRDIWDRKWLTNNGVYHQRFEAALAAYLGVKHVSLFCNGMIALQVGLQALEITGEVITTPFSFPATTHAIHWNHCTPVFCDIDPDTCNLDPAKIEALITPKTTCILPVHVYGNPCDVRGIQAVADKHGLKVFYDAAHAFGVEIGDRRAACPVLCGEVGGRKSEHQARSTKHPPTQGYGETGETGHGPRTKDQGSSILNFGNLSMLSFHATKVFNTIEGGALITNDPEMKKRIDFLKNFGFANETTVIEPGTNGKMNEIQAAYGLLQLKYIDGEMAKRKKIAETYRGELSGICGLRMFDDLPNVTHNYSYFPIFIDAEQFGRSRDELYATLKSQEIFGRRYFYPLISSFPMYAQLPCARPDNLPVANDVAERVLCLPIFGDLNTQTTKQIARLVAACGSKVG